MFQFDLKKQYKNFNLRVQGEVNAEWLVLLAPSGGGKSVTLNMMAGLEQPDSGFLRLGSRTLFDSASGLSEPIRSRRVGYVFQNYALFPHMTVAENITYGIPSGSSGDAVRHWLSFFQLEGREHALPRELSGGQQQRVALARALAAEPDLLLLDEPLSALDRPTRETVQRDLAQLKTELSIPVLLVTHDFQEAQTLGDQVMVLDGGGVVESGRKQALFDRPGRHETARFLGVENILPAEVSPAKGHGPPCITVQGKPFEVEAVNGHVELDASYLCVRASDVRLAVDESVRPNRMRGVVAAIHPAHGVNFLQITMEVLPGITMVMQLDDYVMGRYGLKPGDSVALWLPPGKVFLCA